MTRSRARTRPTRSPRSRATTTSTASAATTAIDGGAGNDTAPGQVRRRLDPNGANGRDELRGGPQNDILNGGNGRRPTSTGRTATTSSTATPTTTSSRDDNGRRRVRRRRRRRRGRARDSGGQPVAATDGTRSPARTATISASTANDTVVDPGASATRSIATNGAVRTLAGRRAYAGARRAASALGQVADGLDVVAVGVEHEGAVVVLVITRAGPGSPLSRPPAASAAAWKASTVGRSGLGEGDVRRRRRLAALADPEVGLLAIAEAAASRGTPSPARSRAARARRRRTRARWRSRGR